MRRAIPMMMVCILPFLSFAQEAESVPKKLTYDDGYVQGKRDGQETDQSKWSAVGFGGGLLGCCLGGGIVYFVASGDAPDSIPQGPYEFREGYAEGYRDATKSNKRKSALIGGIAGTALLVVVLTGWFLSSVPLNIYPS